MDSMAFEDDETKLKTRGHAKEKQPAQKENGAILLAQTPQSQKKRSSPSRNDYRARRNRSQKRRRCRKRLPEPWPTPQQAKKEKPEEVLVLQENKAPEGSLPFHQILSLPQAGAYESILFHVQNGEDNIRA